MEWVPYSSLLSSEKAASWQGIRRGTLSSKTPPQLFWKTIRTANKLEEGLLGGVPGHASIPFDKFNKRLARPRPR